MYTHALGGEERRKIQIDKYVRAGWIGWVVVDFVKRPLCALVKVITSVEIRYVAPGIVT